MPLPFTAYKKKIKPVLYKLTSGQLLFTGVWVVDYLDRSYGSYLNEIAHSAERRVLQNAIAFLWSTVDQPAALNLAMLKEHLTSVRKIDIDDLDFAKPQDCGILKLMEAAESVLVFAKDKDRERILETAWYPLDVLNSIKDSSIPWYVTPPGYDIDDPFFAAELKAQTQLFDHLAMQHTISSKDRLIFRL